jgi:ATP-dependent Clp protease ATP-binding subunit ClpC
VSLCFSCAAQLLNKLKIDYIKAKEQYLNMTPSEEFFFGKFTKSDDLHNDDLGQDDSLKEGTFNNPANKSNKKSKHLF